MEDIPCPRLLPGHVLIRTRQTLVAAGTEEMLVDFGKTNLIDKTGQQNSIRYKRCWTRLKKWFGADN